ncbi:hypothetical protein D9757_004854 [Collybiopsis confluens]|uniref:Uncharacterized protein n=1 Tax=Collybiopsis confluens TaxID=2823264 RepID=A0A8H5MCA4_9AGAR|nr:hypothetical protein D9757_004854 [Collybiopsis confluens]
MVCPICQVYVLQRTFLREITENKTLGIQAIGLSLYEPVEGISEDKIGEQVIRTQGAEAGKILVGKRILIVVSILSPSWPFLYPDTITQDEVDDTRKTLGFALTELQKDVETELSNRPEAERKALRTATRFGIFVVHNKNKPKLAELPPDVSYYAGQEVDDVCNIEEHDRLAALDIQAKS